MNTNGREKASEAPPPPTSKKKTSEVIQASSGASKTKVESTTTAAQVPVSVNSNEPYPLQHSVAIAPKEVTQETAVSEKETLPPSKRHKADHAYQGAVAAPRVGAATADTEETTPNSADLLQPGDDTPTSAKTPALAKDGNSAAPEPALAVAEDMFVPVARASVQQSGSVSSDLSSASAATAEDRHGAYYDADQQEIARARQSPPSNYAEKEVPPAPPSTPASQGSLSLSFSFDGLSDTLGPPSLTASTTTPIAPLLPGGGFVNNAYRLEKEQELLEGAETPAPSKPPAAPAAARSATTAEMAATPRPSAAEAATSKTGGAAPPLPEDFSDWAVGDRYELVRILGRGSYGEVAQAIDLKKTAAQGGETAYVAIKRIQSPFDQQVDAVRLYREMHILRKMREGGENVSEERAAQRRPHDCIIQLLDVVPPPTDDLDDFHDLYLVFEYVDTDLYKLIMSPQYLTTEHIQTFLYQMLAGLKYIHSFSVIHRDLKPANILLNEDCSLKICDFGLARIVDIDSMSMSKHGEKASADPIERKIFRRNTPEFGTPPMMGITRQLTKHVVTRWYRAPELILIQPYTSAVDIWSLGCILAELLSMQEGNVPGYQDRKPLFPGGTCYPLSGEGDKVKADERLDQLRVIFDVIGTPASEDIEAEGKANDYIKSLPKTKGKPLESVYPEADPLAIDLLKKMLRFNPKRRLTAEEALDHEFFKAIRRKELEQTAEGPLEAPSFLESDKIDLRLLKQKIYEEVIWYRDHRGQQKRAAKVGHS